MFIIKLFYYSVAIPTQMIHDMYFYNSTASSSFGDCDYTITAMVFALSAGIIHWTDWIAGALSSSWSRRGS